MSNNRLLALPGLIGGLAINRTSGTPIQDVVCCLYCFSPIHVMQFFGLHQTSCHLHESSILPLCHTILLRSIGYSILSFNTILLTKLNIIRRSILSTSITPHTFYFLLTLILSHLFEFFKKLKYFILMLQEIDPTHSTKIINEGKKIRTHTKTFVLHWST